MQLIINAHFAGSLKRAHREILDMYVGSTKESIEYIDHFAILF